MSKEVIILLSFILCIASWALGARMYKPVQLTEYKFLQPEIDRCEKQGGVLTTSGNTAVCQKTLFTILLNHSYFDQR